MTFASWLDTFIVEKGLDPEAQFTVMGASGTNVIPLGVVAEAMKRAPESEQRAIKKVIVRIDFLNGNVTDYFRHLAQAIAV